MSNDYSGSQPNLSRRLVEARRETLERPIRLRADTDFKRGSATVEFWIDWKGNREDAFRRQGGSMANTVRGAGSERQSSQNQSGVRCVVFRFALVSKRQFRAMSRKADKRQSRNGFNCSAKLPQSTLTRLSSRPKSLQPAIVDDLLGDSAIFIKKNPNSRRDGIRDRVEPTPVVTRRGATNPSLWAA